MNSTNTIAALLALVAMTAAVPLGAAPADQIGVMLQLDNMLPASNRFGNRLPDVDRQFDLMEKAGVTWTRAALNWDQIEPSQGEWNWGAADEVVASARRHHVNLLWLVGYTAGWDSDTGQWDGVPLDLNNANGYFPNFVRKLVRRYKRDVHYWEIRNEPNLNYAWAGASAAKYATYITQAYNVIKAEDPTAQVVFGGLGGSIAQQTDWFAKVVAKLPDKSKPPFDILCFHLYGAEADTNGYTGKGAVARYMADMLHNVEMAAQAAGYANKSIWFSEVDFPAAIEYQTDDPDYHSGPPSQVLFIKSELPKLVADDPTRKIFWASLLDDYTDPGFESMGLVTSDAQNHVGNPRASYRALRELLRH